MPTKPRPAPMVGGAGLLKCPHPTSSEEVGLGLGPRTGQVLGTQWAPTTISQLGLRGAGMDSNSSDMLHRKLFEISHVGHV
ncbi:hypothetical protein PSHT_15877 [Puccinia striiformis]|nr:hypothetical protein PSHT_15877 [Puccinia striiformis]POW10679.1 hypothetical protein PSTT_05862 [Puccinia striiformis]